MEKRRLEPIFDYSDDEKGIRGELSIDQDNKLYWNNKAIVTEQKIKLDLWVNVSIIFASVSTIIIAIVTLLQYLDL